MINVLHCLHIDCLSNNMRHSMQNNSQITLDDITNNGQDITAHYLDIAQPEFKLFRHDKMVYAVQYNDNQPKNFTSMWKSNKISNYELQDQYIKSQPDQSKHVGTGMVGGTVYRKPGNQDKTVKILFKHSDDEYALEKKRFAAEATNARLLQQKFMLKDAGIEDCACLGLWNKKSSITDPYYVMPYLNNLDRTDYYDPLKMKNRPIRDQHIKDLYTLNNLGFTHPDLYYPDGDFKGKALVNAGNLIFTKENGVYAHIMVDLDESGFAEITDEYDVRKDNWILATNRKSIEAQAMTRYYTSTVYDTETATVPRCKIILNENIIELKYDELRKLLPNNTNIGIIFNKTTKSVVFVDTQRQSATVVAYDALPQDIQKSLSRMTVFAPIRSVYTNEYDALNDDAELKKQLIKDNSCNLVMPIPLSNNLDKLFALSDPKLGEKEDGEENGTYIRLLPELRQKIYNKMQEKNHPQKIQPAQLIMQISEEEIQPEQFPPFQYLHPTNNNSLHYLVGSLSNTSSEEDIELEPELKPELEQSPPLFRSSRFPRSIYNNSLESIEPVIKQFKPSDTEPNSPEIHELAEPVNQPKSILSDDQKDRITKQIDTLRMEMRNSFFQRTFYKDRKEAKIAALQSIINCTDKIVALSKIRESLENPDVIAGRITHRTGDLLLELENSMVKNNSSI